MTGGPVLILGGRSDIGLAVARRFARAGHPIRLAVRNPAESEADKTDIELRFDVPVSLHRFDALEMDNIQDFLESLPEVPDVCVCAVGLLGDQDAASADPAQADLLLRTNFLGPALVLEALAARMAAALSQRGGRRVIIGISSVAGDRGRALNYWYGAAKAAFTTMLSGLRQKYARTDLRVVTVKPGFVATKMIAGLPTPAPLTAAPADVAERIYAASTSGAQVIYVGRIWALVMGVLKILPERIFMRLRF